MSPDVMASSPSLTVRSVPVNVTAYDLRTGVNVAVYSASPATATISGAHPLCVYVYCAVDSFTGVAPEYTGTSPKGTVRFCRAVPSSFLKLIVYDLRTGVNVAVYSASPVTATTAGSQPANV